MSRQKCQANSRACTHKAANSARDQCPSLESPWFNSTPLAPTDSPAWSNRPADRQCSRVLFVRLPMPRTSVHGVHLRLEFWVPQSHFQQSSSAYRIGTCHSARRNRHEARNGLGQAVLVGTPIQHKGSAPVPLPQAEK